MGRTPSDTGGCRFLGEAASPRLATMRNDLEPGEEAEPEYEYEARFFENENPASVFVRTDRPLIGPDEAAAGASQEIESDGWRFRILRVVEEAQPPTASELRKIGVLEVEPLARPGPQSS